MNKQGGSRTDGQPSTQGGGEVGCDERHGRVETERRLRAVAERSRASAERLWLARERAQGRNKKEAYARWQKDRKAWLRREARKAQRRKKEKACNEKGTVVTMAVKLEEQAEAVEKRIEKEAMGIEEESTVVGGSKAVRSEEQRAAAGSAEESAEKCSTGPSEHIGTR